MNINHPLAIAGGGAVGVEVIGEALQNVSPIIQVLIQIGIGVAALFKLFKKKKVEQIVIPYKKDA